VSSSLVLDGFEIKVGEIMRAFLPSPQLGSGRRETGTLSSTPRVVVQTEARAHIRASVSLHWLKASCRAVCTQYVCVCVGVCVRACVRACVHVAYLYCFTMSPTLFKHVSRGEEGETTDVRDRDRGGEE
jgi:hypothetical protein